MISLNKAARGKSLSPIFAGFLIFVVSQIFGCGYELILSDKQVGLDLPVPWHLQTFASLLAIALTIFCFFIIFIDRHQRIKLILTLLIFFFVLIPLQWLYFTSHGHLDIMANRLYHFPETLKKANTWVEEENIIPIPTDYGQYKYRFYFDRKESEYVYEIWKEQNMLYSQRIYDFSRKCIRSEPGRCTFVTIPYTPIDLLTVEEDYKKSIITNANQVKDITDDGVLDFVIHEYSGNGDLSQYRIFSLGADLKSTVITAPEPR